MSARTAEKSVPKSHLRTARILRITAFAVLLCLLAIISTCSPPLPVLDEIRASGTLRMATVNSATTYYLAANGPTGFEYDLAKRWAEDLNLDLDVIVVGNRKQAIAAVQSGRAHFAAGLAATPKRAERVRLTQPYFEVTRQVVWRSGNKKPKSIAALDTKLTLPADIDSVEWLRRNHPDLKFKVDADANTEELLVRVAEQKLDYTIADSTLVKLNQRYYPKLRVAFDLEETSHLAWIFPKDRDPGLYNKAVAFLQDMKESQAMRTIVDRYFGHIERVGLSVVNRLRDR